MKKPYAPAISRILGVLAEGVTRDADDHATVTVQCFTDIEAAAVCRILGQRGYDVWTYGRTVRVGAAAAAHNAQPADGPAEGDKVMVKDLKPGDRIRTHAGAPVVRVHANGYVAPHLWLTRDDGTAPYTRPTARTAKVIFVSR